MKWKLVSGTKHTETSGHILEKIDLCAIIDVSSKSRVKRLKFADVEIDFHLGENTSESVFVPTSESSDMEQSKVFDPGLAEELRNSQLLIDDPQGFEQEIVNQHLREINQ